jgi:diguanylate cyclase (GGDEF)-like protein
MGQFDKTIRVSTPAPLPASGATRPCLSVLYGGPVGLVYTLAERTETLIGRGEEADIPILEGRVSRRHAVITVNSEGSVVIEDQGSINGTFVNGVKVRTQELKDGDRVQIGYSCVIKFSYQDDLEHQLQQEIASGIKDPLTGLYTKVYFQDRVGTEFADAKRHNEELGALIFAIDDFDKIGIHYGYRAADHVLKEVARVISQMLRAGDVFARYDEERFAVLARRLDDKGAVILARRIRKMIREHQVEFDGRSIPLTVSIGIGTLADEPEKAAALLAVAEKALTKTKKKAGHNAIGGAAVSTYLESDDTAATVLCLPGGKKA